MKFYCIGEAVRDTITAGVVRRDELFLQTKFTPVRGQDPETVPYDPRLPLQQQVRASFEKSLINLQTDYIDSLILHSPLPTVEETMEVWSVFEELYEARRVRNIGISNLYSLPDLRRIYQSAKIKPKFIQN